MMQRAIPLLFSLVCLLLSFGSPEAVARNEDRILAVTQNMEAAFKRVEDYKCDVEQIFYQDGENQRYLFKFYFKREKRIRVDFSHPYSGLTIIHIDDDKDANENGTRCIRPGKRPGKIGDVGRSGGKEFSY
jgi:outer membrane lipoprotein-sorting protein